MLPSVDVLSSVSFWSPIISSRDENSDDVSNGDLNSESIVVSSAFSSS